MSLRCDKTLDKTQLNHTFSDQHIYVDLTTYVDINIYMLIRADQHIYVDLENQHLAMDYHEQESLRGGHSTSKCNTNF